MTRSLPQLPARPTDGHKGVFGTVCVVGGQAVLPRIMIGGPAFTATAALRSGAGLAVLAVPRPILPAALTIAPSATGLALPIDEHRRIRPSEAAELFDERMSEFDCMAIGPGLGADEPQQRLVVRLIAQDDAPVVVDADALNALAQLPGFQQDFHARAVLTPHPGEFMRLASSLGIQGDPSDPDDRPAAAASLAQRLGCVVVLKGAATIVSDGIETWKNPTGNVALATAGTGDVLTGIIAGFIAQFGRAHMGSGTKQVTPEQQGGLGLYDCARLGVYLHGLAADRWARRHGEAGLLASDLLNELPDALAALRSMPADA